MAPLKNMLSLTCLVWVCVCLGGVAIPAISGQSTTVTDSVTTAGTTDNVTDANITTAPAVSGTTGVVSVEPTSPADSDNSTTAPPGDTTTADNGTTVTAEPLSNGTTAINPNATTEEPSTDTTEGGGSTHPSSLSTPAHTTKPPPSSGHKFDVASFFGGFAAAVGVTIIVFVIARCYCLNRNKSSRYHAM